MARSTRMGIWVMLIGLAGGSLACGGEDTDLLLDPQTDRLLGWVQDGDYVLGGQVIPRAAIERVTISEPRLAQPPYTAAAGDNSIIDPGALQVPSPGLAGGLPPRNNPGSPRLPDTPDRCWKVQLSEGLSCRGCCQSLLCSEICVKTPAGEEG